MEKEYITKVAIGSKNAIKIACVKEAFEKVWPGKKFEFIGVEVSSGISDQPMSDEESIKGARNRAISAMTKESSEWGVGLEDGIQLIGEKYFDCGWVVVRKSIQEGIGSSIKLEVPLKMITLIKKGIELGKVVDIVFDQEDSKQKGGHFGAMTNNAITRKDGYRDGVIAALAAFINPNLFEK
ncbi:MAG: inosine/xanthosine triphosphatase [Candidatus Levybacteria bacterium]|nr:inosine/xanthosine triphosphatase [Candidatus Levybacteria bacterium]